MEYKKVISPIQGNGCYMNLDEALFNSIDGIGKDFSVNSAPAFVLMPTAKSVPSVPWVLFAPTFQGLLPDISHRWLFSRLLAAGIAIAGVDIGDTLGRPAGQKAFTALYQHLVHHHGFAKRACLLVQSRGALMLYPWAAAHPDKVAAVAAIYPVCDLRQYPGLSAAARSLGISQDQLSAALERHNPIDCLAPLAAADIPIFHVHGDADTAVPIEQSSLPLARRYRALGGTMTFDVISGKGHEVIPEFFECRNLADFIFRYAIPAAQKRVF